MYIDVCVICDMILFAQNRGPKAELQCTIWDKKEKKHNMTKNMLQEK